MSKKNLKNKKIQKTIAKNRILNLFSLAEKKALSGNIDLANRYVLVARKISMRNLVTIPNELKRRFCKHCYQFLLPDNNCRFRIHRGRLIIHCNSCKKFTRIPLEH